MFVAMLKRWRFPLGLLAVAAAASVATAAQPCSSAYSIPSDPPQSAGPIDLEHTDPAWTPLPYTVVAMDRTPEDQRARHLRNNRDDQVMLDRIARLPYPVGARLYIHVPLAVEQINIDPHEPGLWESVIATGMQAVVDHYCGLGQPEQVWVMQLDIPTYIPGYVYAGSHVIYAPAGCRTLAHTWPGNFGRHCTGNEKWVAGRAIPPAVASRMRP